MENVKRTYYAGDAFPVIDPVHLGLAAIQTAYMGAEYKVDPLTLTGWTEPIITNWGTRPTLSVDPGNFWWQSSQRLLERAAAHCRNNCGIAIPDLQGGGEILALLRGTENLAVDLYDHPCEIAPALEEINQAWLFYFKRCYELIHQHSEGYVDWLGLWSDKPAVTVECDFMVMISPSAFKKYFLPALVQQVNWMERSVFHLDGPGAIPHLETLLAIPNLNAIQWVPTPEKPHASEWIPLLKKIQAHNKSVVVDCESWEIISLLEELHPDQLVLTTTCSSPQEADELVEKVQWELRR
jgi:hypothetical protein